MAYENGLTHFDKSGQAIMVDVSEKKETSRTAIASGRIRVNRAVYEAIEQGTAKKGDVLGTARIAGIMAAKNTSAVIPLCHPLPIAKCSVDFTMLPEECAVEARDRQGHGADGRRDGSAPFRQRRSLDHLRHVQGTRQGHGNRVHPPR